jgi:glycosyltransferase involved in cell wall biosynthesis
MLTVSSVNYNQPRWRVEFYSSAAGDRLWADLATELTRLGYPTHIVSAISNDEYRSGKAGVGQFRLRWKLTFGFALSCAIRAVRQRFAKSGPPVVRIVATNPFFLPVWIQFWCGRKDRTVHFLFDLYPEALVAAGLITEGSWISRAIAHITRRTIRVCDATVFLGRRIEEHVGAVHLRAARTMIIPVGASGESFRDWPPRPRGASDVVNVLYAGVMGRMHDVVTLAGVLAHGMPAGIRVKAHTTGRGAEWLRRQPCSDQIEWGGPLSSEVWQQVMSESDVALVTLAAGAERVAMPSKTYSALVAGQAILAVCPPNSDLADLIHAHDCGWAVEPGDVAGLHAVLKTIALDRESLLQKRRRAFAAGHSHYSIERVAQRWVQLIRLL